jgi:hypothetical protein
MQMADLPAPQILGRNDIAMAVERNCSARVDPVMPARIAGQHALCATRRDSG